MNKKQKTSVSLGLLALTLAIFGSIAGNAEAHRGNPTIKGPYYSEEKHEAMEKAFETNDYTAWKNLMQNRERVTQIITENNFPQFAEAHRLAEKGDLAGAEKIRKDLGLGLNNGFLQNRNSGNSRMNCANR